MQTITRDPSLHVLQHAVGLDDYGRGRDYRNHFCTEEGTVDWPLCMAHVAAGRMERHGPDAVYGGSKSYCFFVTKAGRRFISEQSPPPPRQTRSQQRYQRFLNADSGLTFFEWLKQEQQRSEM